MGQADVCRPQEDPLLILLPLAWIYYTAVFMLLGAGAVRVVRRITGASPAESGISRFFYPWLGIAVTSLLGSIWSLVYRVNWEFHAAVLLLALMTVGVVGPRAIVAATRQTLRSLGPLVVSVALVATTPILFASTDGPVYNLDPGRYHFQNMLWAKTYAVVPGLANLHTRFGLSSSWYLIHGMAEIFVFEARSYHIFNGLIFTYFMVYALWCLRSLLTGVATTRTVFVLCFCLFLAYYYDLVRYLFLSCLTPDLPVNLFVGVCLLYLFDVASTERPSQRRAVFDVLIYALLATQAFAVRQSAIYLLFPLPFLLLRAWSISRALSIRDVLTSAVLPSLLALPTLARSLVLTGWLIFPAPGTDLFDVDWKYPRAWLLEALANIRVTGFMEGQDPDLKTIVDVMHTPQHQLLAVWLAHQITSGGYLYWPLAGVAATALMLVVDRRGTGTRLKRFALPAVGTVVMLIGWAYSAPHFRFGFGYVGACFAALLATTVGDRPRVAWIRTLSSVMLVCWLVALGNLSLKSTRVSLRENHIFYPLEFARYVIANARPFELLGVPPAKYVTTSLDGRPLHIAQWDTGYVRFGRNEAFIPRHFNAETTDAAGFIRPSLEAGHNAVVATMIWMAPLPAVGGLMPGVEMRGPSLSNGFRIRQ